MAIELMLDHTVTIMFYMGIFLIGAIFAEIGPIESNIN